MWAQPSALPVVSNRRQAVAALVGGTLLAVGASVGVAAAAGFHSVLAVLTHIRPGWLAIVLGAQLIAVGGYTTSCRQVLRVRGGPKVHRAWAGALTTVDFGAYLSRGGVA